MGIEAGNERGEVVGEGICFVVLVDGVGAVDELVAVVLYRKEGEVWGEGVGAWVGGRGLWGYGAI